MHEAITFKLTGKNPLLVNNPQTVNPTNQYAVAQKEITAKAKKTDEGNSDLLRLKWMGALYWQKDIGPYLPAICVWRSFHDAAKLSKLGTAFVRAVHMSGREELPIAYQGPRDIDALYADPRFVDVRDAKIKASRVLACRPIFREWALTSAMSFDPSLMDRSELVRIAETAGDLIGVGTYRQRFGRFDVTVQ
jgi:hypothetical protein